MTSAKDVARDIYINVRHEEWGVDSVEEAVKDAIKQARVKALEEAGVIVLNECNYCGGTGEDDNTLNDPGPCLHCTPAIDQIRALAETKQENG